MRQRHAAGRVGPLAILLPLSLGILVSCVSVSTAAPATSPPDAGDIAGLGEPATAVSSPGSTPSAVGPPADEPVAPLGPDRIAAAVELAPSPASSGPASSAAAAGPDASTEPVDPFGAEAVPALERSPTPEPASALEPIPRPGREPASMPTPEPMPSPGPFSSPEVVPGLDAMVPPSLEPVAPAVRAARSRPVMLDARTDRQLLRILRRFVKDKGVAGLQAAVRLRDGRMWLGSAGKAEFNPSRPIADDTPFAIASVTKTFTAALILKLHDEGKLDIDEPFGRYEPLAPRGRRVTIRQLLSHTSGLYDYFSNPRYIKASGDWLRVAPSGIGDRDHRWTYEEILGLVKAGYCKPGTCYRYSNTNYAILGKVAEAAGGAPIHEQLRQRFFEPLGMRDTYYQPDEPTPLGAAHGHWSRNAGGHIDHTREARVVPFMAAASVASSAGAIASTAHDLAIWAEALYGGQVLSPASRREMTRILPDGTYGLGTDVAVFAGHLGYGHRGGLRGFEASMWYFPESGASVVLLSNHGNWYLDGISIDQPVGRLVRAALGRG